MNWNRNVVRLAIDPLDLDIDRRRVSQRRHTNVRPGQRVEVEADILRVLDLRPSDFLVSAC